MNSRPWIRKKHWPQYNVTNGLLGHKRVLERFDYSRRDWARDSLISTYVVVEAIYKGQKIVYVQLLDFYDDEETGGPGCVSCLSMLIRPMPAGY